MPRPVPRLSAACAVVSLTAFTNVGLCDWNSSIDARWRYDTNVGNAGYPADVVSDSVVAAKISAFDASQLSDGLSIVGGLELTGERYDHVKGLGYASVDGRLALRKKWGLGSYAPWARLGLMTGHADYASSYRNATIYQATVSGGRRFDEHWSLGSEYVVERRRADAKDPVEYEVSADAYSQLTHQARVNALYVSSNRVNLTGAVVYRFGDVISTTKYDHTVARSVRAIADDPAFGNEYYAYRLRAATYGVTLGVNFIPSPHHSVGFSISRYETRAAGGFTYKKSVPALSWDYVF